MFKARETKRSEALPRGVLELHVAVTFEPGEREHEQSLAILHVRHELPDAALCPLWDALVVGQHQPEVTSRGMSPHTGERRLAQRVGGVTSLLRR